MPVIVLGADTEYGRAVIKALLARPGEVRAFVTDAETVGSLKAAAVKVAVGDVSDASHVGGAALNTFSAVLVAEAAVDGRERAFAATPDQVVAAWAEGLADAGVHRAIWIAHERLPGAEAVIRPAVVELAVVDPAGREPADVAAEVAHLDEVAAL